MAGENQTLSLPNVVFAQGYLYGTAPGSTDFADDLQFGELENVSFDFKQTSEKLHGPESLYPIMIAASQREIAIKAKWAQIRVRTLRDIIGGAAPVATGGITYMRSGDSTDNGNPLIQLHLKSPLDGTDAEMVFFAVYSEQLGLQFNLRKTVMPDWTAEACRPSVVATTDPVTGAANTNRDTWVMGWPGDQTTDAATVLPGVPGTFAVTAGASASKQIISSWTAPSGSPTAYSVEMSTAPTGPFLVLGTTTELTFVDVEAASGTLKYFRVRAINNVGYGPYSAILSATSP